MIHLVTSSSNVSTIQDFLILPGNSLRGPESKGLKRHSHYCILYYSRLGTMKPSSPFHNQPFARERCVGRRDAARTFGTMLWRSDGHALANGSQNSRMYRVSTVGNNPRHSYMRPLRATEARRTIGLRTERLRLQRSGIWDWMLEDREAYMGTLPRLAVFYLLSVGLLWG